MLSSRSLRLAAVLAVAASLITACGGDDPAPGEAGAADKPEPITLVFESYTFGTDSGGDGTQQLIDEFEAAHPDIEIEPVGTPSADIHVSVQTQAAAGDPPDVAQIGWSKFTFVLENLPYAPIEEVAGDEWNDHTEGFVPEALAIGQHDGEVVGLASIISTPTLIYNADLFEAAGLDPDEPPDTWEDTKEAGLTIAERTDAEGVYVAVVDPAKSDYLTQSLIYSNGGEVLTEDGEVAFDEPESIEALAMVQDLTESGAQPAIQAADAVQLFGSGQLGMIVVSSAPLASLVAAAEGAFEVKTGGMPAFGEQPVAPTNSGAGLFVFTDDAERQAAAWEFVKFLTSKRGFTIATSEIGYLPLRPDILDDPEFLGDFLDQDPRLLPTIEQLDALHPYQDLPGPDADRARQILQDDAVEPIVLGGADPATTLEAAAERIADLLP